MRSLAAEMTGDDINDDIYNDIYDDTYPPLLPLKERVCAWRVGRSPCK